MTENKPLILITNDDGVDAKGIKFLAETVKDFGKVVVVAPAQPMSAQSHAITVRDPLRYKLVSSTENFEVYVCNGTPVDCIKLGLHQIMSNVPSIILSGINHGPNLSASVFYSGTMAAAIEGCLNQIPSIGFSLDDFSHNADFSQTRPYIRQIVQQTLEQGLANNVCLNVNFPAKPEASIKGVKIVRQLHGKWREEFIQREHPHGGHYYWLSGDFISMEPEATDTDTWAVENGYVSIVPTQLDLTAHHFIQNLKTWNLNVYEEKK